MFGRLINSTRSKEGCLNVASSFRRPRRTTARLSVAVFGGAGPATPAAMEFACELGALLGDYGHRLVYGGSGSGLMGTLAWSAHQHGAQIVGVIPHSLHERELHIAAPPQTVRLTHTLGQRKDLMLDMADALIALPGGLEAADEILHVITLAQLKMHGKPLTLVETAGEWQPLLQFLKHMSTCGYADPLVVSRLHVATDIAEALQFISRRIS